MKKVNFKELSIQLTFEGQPVVLDVRKTVGNTIRQNTADIGLDELARTIYFSEGAIEIPDEYIPAILRIQAPASPFRCSRLLKNNYLTYNIKNLEL